MNSRIEAQITGWDIIRFGDVGDWYSGGTPSRSNAAFWNGHIPWVSPKDMKRFRLGDAIEHITELGATYGSRIVPPGTVMFVIRGMILTHTFPVCVTTKPVAFNQDMKAVICNEETDPDFVAYWLLANAQRILALASESTHGTKRFDLADLAGLPLQRPPFAEQRRIARILTTLDNLIEKTKALIAKYQAIKQGMMHDLFTRGVDTHGHVRLSQAAAPDLYKQTEIGWIPKEWEVKQVGEVCATASGGTPSRDMPSFWNGNIPWVKTGEVNYCVIDDTEEKITESGMNNSAAHLLPKGTVVMALFGQGPTRGRVGVLGIDATVNQACLALLPSSAVTTDYLYFTLVAAYDRIRSLSNDGAQQNLNASLVRSFVIPVPQLSEQRQIAAIFQHSQSLLDRETILLAKLQFQKSGLMQDLLTGKVRVKVDEVAA